MFLGFAMILPFAYFKLGGWDYISVACSSSSPYMERGKQLAVHRGLVLHRSLDTRRSRFPSALLRSERWEDRAEGDTHLHTVLVLL